jgi:hypothetical protein
MLNQHDESERADEAARQQRERIADDLLIGAKAIAAELGIPEHAVYHLTKKKKKEREKARPNLPIQRWGRTLVASRNKLRRAAAALTSA